MKKFEKSAETKRPGTFNTQEDFLAFALNTVDAHARFHFTGRDGRVEWLPTATACEALRRLSKFLSTPEKIDSPTLGDGRMEVAHHNWTSLTQLLRWAAGLDSDSNPRVVARGGEERPEPKWSYAAQMWFWSNGGRPVPGLSGTHSDWMKELDKKGGDLKSLIAETARALECEEVPA